MSHQAQGSDSCSRENHQDLHRALVWLMKRADFSAVCFRKDCRWSRLGLVMSAILWAWSGATTLGSRFEQAKKIGRRMLGKKQVPDSSYQAFTKLLQTWTAKLFSSLSQAFRARMASVFANRWKIGDFVPLAVDGSRFELPRTKSNEEYFATPARKRTSNNKKNNKDKKKLARAIRRRQSAKSRAKKANNPQMWVTTVWHLCIGLPWSWRLGPSNSSERDHLLEMLSELKDFTALLVADAGFFGYALWSQIISSNHHFIIRVGSNVNLLKNLGYVKEQNGLVYCWPDHAAKKSQSPLILRLIVIHNGKHPVYLVTSVLDKNKLSDRDAIRAYRLRWGIEVYYRHVKQTFDRTKLRSHSPENALSEANWSLLGLWAMSIHAQYLLQSQGQDPQRLSVANMLRAYRLAMDEYRCPPEKGKDLRSSVGRALLDDYQRKCKASRNYPRKKQETPAGPPNITVATSAQRKKAREIKRELEKGLTA